MDIETPGPRAGAGRPKGVPNKSTTRAREAIGMLIESNLDNLQLWLERIAEDDPKGAFRCVTDVLDYHIPRLKAMEISLGASEAPAPTVLVVIHSKDQEQDPPKDEGAGAGAGAGAV